MLDLRLPSGAFFAITGAILVVLGLISNPQAPMLNGGNVDLCAGLVILAFGVSLLALAKRSPQA